jgi:hypothetical protein
MGAARGCADAPCDTSTRGCCVCPEPSLHPCERSTDRPCTADRTTHAAAAPNTAPQGTYPGTFSRAHLTDLRAHAVVSKAHSRGSRAACGA